MKRKLSFLFAVLLTVAASFSYKMAYSQSEPDLNYHNHLLECVCVDRNGALIVYAMAMECHDGGDEMCINEPCPPTPPTCW